MSLYKSDELINKSNLETKNMHFGGYVSSDLAKAVNKLNEHVKAFSSYTTYDVFLSHSIKDARIIYGLKLDLERRGLSVYVDWIEDNQLDRSNVDKATADLIRKRIKQCRCLLYAASELSKQSSWVQWELGFADGEKNGKVAIIPIEDSIMINRDFYKQEYLGLYPYIDQSAYHIWVNGVKSGDSNYRTLQEWL